MSFVNEIIKELLKRDELEIKDRVRVSETLECMRIPYFYRVMGVKPESNFHATVLGALFHKYVVPPIAKEYAKFLGMEAEFEVEVSIGILVGHVDVLLHEKVEKKPFRWELSGIEMIPWEWKTTTLTMQDYRTFKLGRAIKQVNAYAVMLGVDKYMITVVSFNKDSAEKIYTFEGSVKKDDFIKLYERAIKLMKYVKKEKIPPKPKNTIQCLKCPFKNMCY